MDSPTVELMSALASLFQDTRYSDLTIACGEKRYSVHRALIATRSSFFEGACRNSFLESQTGVIDLSEDDPEAVKHMVHYFYHLDYMNKTISRRSSRRSSRPRSPVSPRQMQRKPVKNLNLAFIEDPLLATASAINVEMPLTPPAEEDTFSNLDESMKLPSSPMVDQFAIEDTEDEQDEPDVDLGKAHLVTHAKVYAIAEKYGIAGLKTVSRKKFADELDMHLGGAEFPEACQEAYESTFHTDRGLRDIIIQTFRSNPSLSLRQDVELMVRETPGLAFELFRMASGLPVAS